MKKLNLMVVNISMAFAVLPVWSMNYDTRVNMAGAGDDRGAQAVSSSNSLVMITGSSAERRSPHLEGSSAVWTSSSESTDLPYEEDRKQKNGKQESVLQLGERIIDEHRVGDHKVGRRRKRSKEARHKRKSISFKDLEHDLKHPELSDYTHPICQLIPDDLKIKMGLTNEVIDEACNVMKSEKPDEYKKLIGIVAHSKRRSGLTGQSDDLKSELAVMLFKLIYQKMVSSHGSLP